ncbi:hypothetical protein, partial [Vibrio parahaemolyticus]|uniref:hypothetical protein n=1 Tax=Vibrio parahaemolyticus TaxID=670 RepID=UPI001C60A93C
YLNKKVLYKNLFASASQHHRLISHPYSAFGSQKFAGIMFVCRFFVRLAILGEIRCFSVRLFY